MSKVSLDFESRSRVDIKKRGSYPYFECADFRPLMAAYRIDGGDIKMWLHDEHCPAYLRWAIEDGSEIHGWNVAFEAQCLDWLHKHRGWPAYLPEQLTDTAAAAAALGLPRSLGEAAKVMGMADQKDTDGTRLINLFCKPNRKGVFNEAAEYPEDWALFQEYCKQDVRTEEALSAKVPALSARERRVWLYDFRKNRRGIRIDVNAALGASKIAKDEIARLNGEMYAATGGVVATCSQIAKLKAWCESCGVKLKSTDKANVLAALADPGTPPDVRQALLIRQEAGKTSVAKLDAMLRRASADGRVRGTSIYHGASTGRNTSTGVNFSNMPRPSKHWEDTLLDKAALFRAFRSGEASNLPEWKGGALQLISDATRSFIWAAPGKVIVQADYASIEGVFAAWIVGEAWKVEAYRELSLNPKLPDIYRRTAARLLGTTTDEITKKHPMRQALGKVSELACFAADTRVLTDSGIKTITELQPSDKLWDGLSWVSHSGVVQKGVRQVVSVDGIRVTPDHLVLTGPTWLPARELVSRELQHFRALATGLANLPSPLSTLGQLGVSSPSSSNAPAERRPTRLTFTTCDEARALAAAYAETSRRNLRVSSTTATPTLCPTTSTGEDSSTASPPASAGARTPKTGGTPTTAGAELACSGDETDALFSRISSLLRAGMSRRLSWIESTSTRATPPETFVSSPELSTRATDGKPRPCNLALPSLSMKSSNYEIVYDVVHAGPRNRFTVLSDSGAFIVHNCGYGGGVGAFYMFAQLYGVDLNALHGPVSASASEENALKAARRYARCVKRGQHKSDAMSRNAWIACELAKLAWRDENPAITASWKTYEDAMRLAVLEPGSQQEALGVAYRVAHGFLWCRLPSGRPLAYASPRLRECSWVRQRNEDGTLDDPEAMDTQEAYALVKAGLAVIEGPAKARVTACGVDSVTRQWRRYAITGGLALENIVQAGCRDILVDGLVRLEDAGWELVSDVYDEAIAEAPIGRFDLDEFVRLFCQLAPCYAGLPISAEPWFAKRYRK